LVRGPIGLDSLACEREARETLAVVGMSTKTVTRRRAVVLTAKAVPAVAVVAWAAPRFETVAGAAGTGTGTDPVVTTAGTGTGTGTAGSPCPDPDAPSCEENTTTTRPGASQRVSCRIEPEEAAAGQTVRASGEGYEASSTVEVRIPGVGRLGESAVQPNGTFARNFTVPQIEPGSYRIEVVGTDADGHPVRCFNDLTVVTRTTGGGSTTTNGTGTGTGGSGNGNSGNGGADNGGAGNGDGGSLPFTGSDSTNLLWLGAGALVAGRLLYGVRERLAERDGAVS
jgi:hypothetical protein